MGLAKEAVLAQLLNLFLVFVCFVAGAYIYKLDRAWNESAKDQVGPFLVEVFGPQSREVGIEDEEVVLKYIVRERSCFVLAVIFYGVIAIPSFFHFLLSLAVNMIGYRQTFNICFHSGASVLNLIASILFQMSFLENNHGFKQIFIDLFGTSTVLVNGVLKGNPCYFPPHVYSSNFGESQCQYRYTKFTLMCVSYINTILYWVTAYVIGCFVEVNDSADLLYAELAAQSPPLRSLDSLPPLPYYARPLQQSPTSKRADKRLNRVEVSA